MIYDRFLSTIPGGWEWDFSHQINSTAGFRWTRAFLSSRASALSLLKMAPSQEKPAPFFTS